MSDTAPHLDESAWLREQLQCLRAENGALRETLAATEAKASAAAGALLRYKTLVNTWSSAVWDAGIDGTGHEAWDWWHKLTGQPREEGLGWGWLDRVHIDDRERTRAAWESALRDRTAYRSLFRVRTAAGEWRYIESRGAPVTGEHGAEWIGTFDDVTAQCLAAEALSASEERFRSVFELAAVGIAQTTIPEGRYVAVNQKMASLTGYTAGELIAKRYLEITHPDDAEANQRLFEELIAGRTPSYTITKRYVRKDGGIAWVKSTVSLVRDMEGKPASAIGVIEDVTEARLAGERAEESASKLRLVADSVPALISYIDRDFRYSFVNQTYEQWFGLARRDVSGRQVAEVLGAEAFAELEPLMSRAMGGETVRFERWVPYRTGRRYVRGAYVPDLDPAGVPRGITVMIQDLSDKRAADDRAEALNRELQDKVREFETLLRSLPVGVAISHDEGARDIRVNRAFAKMLGVSEEENASVLSGKPLPFRFVRDGAELPAAELPQQIAQREKRDVHNVELTVERVDGRRFALYGSAVPLFDAESNVRGSISAYVDVTELREAEKAVRDSERKLLRLIETSPFGIAISNFEGGIEYANGAFQKMTGYTASDIAAGDLQWTEMTPPEWLPFDQEAARQLRDTGIARPFEKEYIRKDGTRVPVLIGGCLLKQPYSEEQRIVVFALDLTEAKRAEAVRRRSEEQYRELFEHAADAVLVATLDGRCTDVNQAGCRLLGYSREELLGMEVHHIAAPEDAPRLDQVRELTLRGGTHSGLWKLRRKNGTWAEVEISSRILPDGRWHAFARDVEARLRAEAAQCEANEELRRANRDLEQFAYAAAHDLQEPLRMVTLYAQLLERRCSDQLAEQGLAYLAQVVESALRAQLLVADLLSYTHVIHADVDAGESAEVSDALEVVQLHLAAAIADSGARIEAHELPSLPMSGTHLVQMLQNLISNALKYRKESEPPHIRVSAARGDGAWVVSVADNGIGIAPSYHETVFGLFKRLHGKSIAGTGIGLAVCKRLAERYKGRIWVESSGQGAGSTFRFAIPDRTAGS